jgi:phosphatidylglycerophosphate synthase
MRKISSDLENPIDNVLLQLSEKVSPIFKFFKHTPNVLTGYSTILGIFAVKSLYNYETVNFVIFYFVSYFFDCLDGHYARKYAMTSKFGDYFDHGKDFILTLATVYVFLTKYSINRYEIGLLLACGFLSMKHMGCQQLVEKKRKRNLNEHKETLDIFMNICSNADSIVYTRYFGSGTLVVLFLVIVYLNNIRNQYIA